MSVFLSQPSHSYHIRRKREDEGVVVVAEGGRALFSSLTLTLSFCSPRTRGLRGVAGGEREVMVKRSDRERKETEKNRKWPWEGYKSRRE